MAQQRIKKTFEIETTPDCMRRFERFLALIHHNSMHGHSGLFAMPVDGDGPDSIKVTPTPGHQYEVDLVAGIGGGVEIAYDNSYGVKRTQEMGSSWIVTPSATLYKDGEPHKTYPTKAR